MSTVPFLREILAELSSAPGAASEVEAARTLLRYYLKKAQALESLTGAPALQPRGKARPRKPRVRTKPYTQHRTRNFILSILRDVPGQAMNAVQIQKRLAEEQIFVTRQTVSYQLHQLKRRGEVTELAGGGRKWCAHSALAAQ